MVDVWKVYTFFCRCETLVHIIKIGTVTFRDYFNGGRKRWKQNVPHQTVPHQNKMKLAVFPNKLKISLNSRSCKLETFTSALPDMSDRSDAIGKNWTSERLLQKASNSSLRTSPFTCCAEGGGVFSFGLHWPFVEGLTLTAWGSTLVVRIWRLQTSDSDDWSPSLCCKNQHIYIGRRPIT